MQRVCNLGIWYRHTMSLRCVRIHRLPSFAVTALFGQMMNPTALRHESSGAAKVALLVQGGEKSRTAVACKVVKVKKEERAVKVARLLPHWTPVLLVSTQPAVGRRVRATPGRSCTTTLTGAPPAQIELPSSRRQSVALSWVMQAPPAAQSGAVGAGAEAGPLGGSVVEATRDGDHASNGSKVTALLTPPHAACWRHACLMQVRWILMEGPVEGRRLGASIELLTDSPKSNGEGAPRRCCGENAGADPARFLR